MTQKTPSLLVKDCIFSEIYDRPVWKELSDIFSAYLNRDEKKLLDTNGSVESGSNIYFSKSYDAIAEVKTFMRDACYKEQLFDILKEKLELGSFHELDDKDKAVCLRCVKIILATEEDNSSSALTLDDYKFIATKGTYL